MDSHDNQLITTTENAQPGCHLFTLPPLLRVQIYEYCFTPPAVQELPLGSTPSIPNNLIATCRRTKADSAEIREATRRETTMNTTFTIQLLGMPKSDLDLVLTKIEPEINLYKRIIYFYSADKCLMYGLTPYDARQGGPEASYSRHRWWDQHRLDRDEPGDEATCEWNQYVPDRVARTAFERERLVLELAERLEQNRAIVWQLFR
jgi:hypothetical protein